MTLDVHKIVRCVRKRHLLGNAVTVGKWIYKQNEKKKDKYMLIQFFKRKENKITKNQMLLS